jgi:hypothetical protein
MYSIKHARRNKRYQKPGDLRWLTIGLVAGSLLFAAACTSAAKTTLPSAISSPTSQSTLLTGDPSIGPVDAPVTIIEYGDFG